MLNKITLDLVKVTEVAAIAAAKWIGKGDKNKADGAAVDAMRKAFDTLDISGTVVIGEGERDKAPMLFIGEKVGNGGIEIDIAVDPLECTNNVAYNKPNSIAVLAAAPKGTMLHAPDTYMDKIAVGPKVGNVVSLNNSIEENIKNVANALGKDVSDVNVIVLDRERNKKFIDEIRRVGARVKLILDGDVVGAISPCIPETGIDMLIGIGAAPEGVLAATALACLGGYMEGRLFFRNNEEKERAKKMGMDDLEKVMKIEDLTDSNNSVFVATGVTGGPLLNGIKFEDKIITHSVVMEAKTKVVRFIENKNPR